MKKILIPILSTAAIAPVATTMVACGSAIVLNFADSSAVEPGTPSFELEHFNVTAGKEYTIKMDFSKATSEALKCWSASDDLGLAAVKGIGSDLEINPIDTKKCKVILNGKDYTNECEPFSLNAEDEEIIALVIPIRNWKSTDKLTYKMVWKNNMKDGILAFASL